MTLKRLSLAFVSFIFSILGVARAATSPIPDEQLQPILSWLALLLNKNINTIDMLYLVVLLGLFTGIIIYFGLKKSGTFGDSFVNTNIEAGLSIIIALLVLRFMPLDYFLVMLLAMLILAAAISVFTLLSIGKGVFGQQTVTPGITLLIAGFVLQSIPSFVTSIIKNTGIPQKGISDIMGYVGMLVPLGWLFILVGFISVIFGVKRLFTKGRNFGANSVATIRERFAERATRKLERGQRGRSTAQRERATMRELNVEKSQYFSEVREARQLHETAKRLAASNPNKAGLIKAADRLIRSMESLSIAEVVLLRDREKALKQGKDTKNIDRKIDIIQQKLYFYQKKKDGLERALNKSPARTRPRKGAKAQTRRTKIKRKNVRRRRR